MAREGSLIVRTFVRVILPLLVVPVVGTLGFMWIEGWEFLDSLYMSVITITTVGYEEVRPLSDAGRVFVVGYLVIGLGIFAFCMTQLGEFILRGQLRDMLGGRRMEAAIKHKSDHVILCGYGRMGRNLTQKLAQRRDDIVVVERDREKFDTAVAAGVTAVYGDATEDSVLKHAGIERARDLVAVLGSDADNLYVTLSARLLRPDLKIFTQANDEKNIDKLKKAGADRVISLYEASALKFTQLVANPNIDDFIEVFDSPETEIDLVQFRVPENASFAGKPLSDCEFERLQVMIVGVQKSSGEFLIPPPGPTRLEVGDRLFGIGKSSALAELTQFRQ